MSQWERLADIADDNSTLRNYLPLLPTNFDERWQRKLLTTSEIVIG